MHEKGFRMSTQPKTTWPSHCTRNRLKVFSAYGCSLVRFRNRLWFRLKELLLCTLCRISHIIYMMYLSKNNSLLTFGFKQGTGSSFQQVFLCLFYFLCHLTSSFAAKIPTTATRGRHLTKTIKMGCNMVIFGEDKLLCRVFWTYLSCLLLLKFAPSHKKEICVYFFFFFTYLLFCEFTHSGMLMPACLLPPSLQVCTWTLHDGLLSAIIHRLWFRHLVKKQQSVQTAGCSHLIWTFWVPETAGQQMSTSVI